jgi:hypothetical protein
MTTSRIEALHVLVAQDPNDGTSHYMLGYEYFKFCNFVTAPSKAAEKPNFAEAAQNGPDARRRAIGRVRRTSGTPQRAPKRAGYPSKGWVSADVPFSAAC